MSAVRRPVDDIVLVPRLGDADAVAIIAALVARARAYEASAEALDVARAELAARDRASAERCRALADRLARLRHATRHRA